ncbi:MAG: hypothetical protein SPL13_01200 [Clostridia bacterium]|nr:hypothetical protein [Clostridia bacterium]
MEYSKEQEKIIAQRLVEYLQRNKKVITYSNLSAKRDVKIEPNGFDEYLKNIGEKCRQNNFPLLSSIVINYHWQYPGEGFYKAFYPELVKADDVTKRAKAREDQERVFEFNEWFKFLELYAR